MRIQRVFYLAGRCLLIISIFLLFPLISSLVDQSGDTLAFALSALLSLIFGLGLMRYGRTSQQKTLRQRDSYLFVTLTWLLASLFGALPFLFSGTLPDFASAFYESMSGFTTTGSTAFADVEIQTHAILLWRALTHFLGGAGIVVLLTALLHGSRSGENSSIFHAEYSGSALSQQIAPRVEDSAKAVFLVYLGLNAACFVALLLAGMSPFDALCHALSTISTGGFSTRNASIGAFHSAAIEWVVAGFLILASLNLSLYYLLLVRGSVRRVLRDEELRTFLAIVLVATVLTTYAVWHYYGSQSVGFRIRNALFLVTSSISTAGLGSENFDLWPSLARYTIFFLMIISGCSGSTAGGIKTIRWLIALKRAGCELTSVFRPAEVQRVEYNGRPVSEQIQRSFSTFINIYFCLILVGGLLLSATGLSWEEALISTLSNLGNVGLGTGSIGPAGGYAVITPFGKYVLCALMLIGRLEVYTVMVLLLPKAWKK